MDSNNSLKLTTKPQTAARAPLKKSSTTVTSEDSKHPKLLRSSTSKPFPTIHPSLITIKAQIGSGKSSSVHTCSVGSSNFALKIIPKAYKKFAKTESEILQTLKDESIVKFYKKFERPDQSWLVFELINGSDLFAFMQKKRLKVDFIKDLSRQLVRVIQKIHKAGIVYRDLKPENIMIENTGNVKIVDFGLAVKIGDERVNSICGSAQYMAPEVVKGEFYGYEVDFWSLGAVVFECFVGRPPFGGQSFKEICEQVVSGEVEFGLIHDVWGRDFVRRLMCREPEERLGQENSKCVDIWTHRFLMKTGSDDIS